MRSPLTALGMLIGFVVAGALRAMVLAAVGGRRSNVRWAARRWQTWLDPFGAVAALIAGIGWLGVSDRFRPMRGLLVDLGVHLVLAAAALAAFAALLGGAPVIAQLQLEPILHGATLLVSPAERVLIGAGLINLGCAVLTLVPIPPLAAGVLLWSKLPRTAGARRIAYSLLEEQWGVAAVLVLLILPLVGGESPLLALVDTVANALLRLAG